MAVLFVLAVFFVMSVPFWMWAGDEFPRLRLWGLFGAIAFAGTLIFGGAIDNETARTGIRATALGVTAICWGGALLVYLLTLLRAGWFLIGPVVLVILGIGLYFNVSDGTTWGEYWELSKWNILIAGTITYFIACHLAGAVDGLVSFDAPVRHRGAPNEATLPDEPSGGVFDDPKQEALRQHRVANANLGTRNLDDPY